MAILYYQVSFIGSWVNSRLAEEVWQFGFKVSRNGTEYDTPQDFADDAGPLLKAKWTGTGNVGVTDACQLDRIKFAPIQANGHYETEPGVYNASAAKSPTSGGVMSPQVTLAVTTVADVFRGPGRYGRFYLPSPVPNNNGFLTSAKTLEVANWAKSLFTTLMTDTEKAYTPVHVKPGGELAGITEIWVGDLYDTQRRRRNKLRETYSKISYV